MVKGERELHICLTDVCRMNFRSSIWVLRNATMFKPPTVVPIIIIIIIIIYSYGLHEMAVMTKSQYNTFAQGCTYAF